MEKAERMMNERIKELLQESYSHFGHGKFRTPELVAEKLAELDRKSTRLNSSH